MSGKPEEHHHTCSEAKDHHCPECCPCKCCSRHSRTYEAHRPIYPWEKDYKDAEEWRHWRELDGEKSFHRELSQFSPSDTHQAIKASLQDPNKVKKKRRKLKPMKMDFSLYSKPEPVALSDPAPDNPPLRRMNAMDPENLCTECGELSRHEHAPWCRVRA